MTAGSRLPLAPGPERSHPGGRRAEREEGDAAFYEGDLDGVKSASERRRRILEMRSRRRR